jgi:hypothetical protein
VPRTRLAANPDRPAHHTTTPYNRLADQRAGRRGGPGRNRRTPLGLWLPRTIYTAPGADPAALTDPARFPTTAALRAHLFDRLIPAVIAMRPPSADPADPFRPCRHHNPDDARRWLTYIAHLLTHPRNPDGAPPRTRDLAWWRIAQHANIATATTKLKASIALGLVSGLAAGLVLGLLNRLAVGTVLGLASGFAFGQAVWTGANEWIHQSPGFANLRLRGRNRQLPGGLVFGRAFGLVGGLVFGLVGGLAVWLQYGNHHAWAAYLIATRHLARRGILPRDLMRFLDDAHRLGLLRAVGPLYQFRHAELQDHLATASQPPP